MPNMYVSLCYEVLNEWQFFFRRSYNMIAKGFRKEWTNERMVLKHCEGSLFNLSGNSVESKRIIINQTDTISND